MIFAFSMPLAHAIKLNYNDEYDRILEQIEKSNNSMRVLKTCATRNQIEHLLKNKRPVVLHISCHGGRSSEGDFLVLENEEDVTEKKFYQNQLEEALKESVPDLVFVAACHSEQIGIMFLKAGSKHVICINTDQAVKDEAIRFFISYFYECLFSKKLRPCEAFYTAKKEFYNRSDLKDQGPFRR